MTKNKLFGIIIALFSCQLQAQDSIGLNKAIELALQNNYQIQIVKNQEDIAVSRAKKGLVGYYPSANITSGGQYSRNNSEIEFAGNNPKQVIDGAENISGNIGLNINYVLFNGFGRINNYNNLLVARDASALQVKLATQQLILNVVNNWLNIYLNKTNLESLIKNIEISGIQLKRIKKGYENGINTKIDLLTAEINHRSDSLALFNAQTELKKSKANLLQLMVQNPHNNLEIPSQLASPQINTSLDIYYSQAESNNISLLLAQLQRKVGENNIAIQKSAQLPEISLSTGYRYSTSRNGAGFILLNNQNGFNLGANLSIPIFQGGRINQSILQAEIELKNNDLELERSKLDVKTQLYNLLLDYELTQSQIIQLEKSMIAANLSLQRAELAYQSGQITLIELRNAQLLLVQNNLNYNRTIIQQIRLAYQIEALSGGLVD